MRDTSIKDIQEDLFAVLTGPEWKVDSDAFDPAGILHAMKATADALRPRLLAVHHACQGLRRPPWLGPAAKLVEDVAWMMDSWGGLALAYDVDWSNHTEEFTANVNHLERSRNAVRESIKDSVPVPNVRVPRYSKSGLKATSKGQRVALPSIPGSRTTRAALSAGAVLVGVIGLLTFALSGRDDARRHVDNLRRLAAPAALPSSTASAAPHMGSPILAPALPPAADNAETVPAASTTVPAPGTERPDAFTEPPPVSLAQATVPSRSPKTFARATPPPAPAPRLAPAHQSSTSVLSLAVDPPAYGPDRVTTSFVVKVTTTGPGPVTLALTAAGSPWRGMLGWSNLSYRTISLAGQTSYVVRVPFNGRDFCGTASGFNYWGAMVTSSPAAPNREVYVDLPAVC